MQTPHELRRLRLEKGYSQENMAKLLGMSQTNYSNIEAGKNELTLSRVMKLAEALEMNPTELFSRLTGNSNDTLSMEERVARLEQEMRTLLNLLMKHFDKEDGNHAQIDPPA